MSVRTTTVVGTGLVALVFIGVLTIFGESLSALVAPSPAAESAAAHAPGTTPPAAPQAPQTGTAPVNGDGGTTRTGPDGSS